MSNPLLGTLILSTVAWLGGYYGQKYDDGSEQRVKVASWFKFVFGAPMPDGQMTIQGMAFQSVAYLSVLGALVFEVTISDFNAHVVATVGWIVFLWFCAAIWIRIIAPRALR